MKLPLVQSFYFIKLTGLKPIYDFSNINVCTLRLVFLNDHRFSIFSWSLFDVIAIITLITYASLQLWRENGCLFPIYSMIHQDIHGIQVSIKLVNFLRSFCFDVENHLFFIIKMTEFH